MGYDNSAPYEVIAAPVEAWIAAALTARPEIDAAPSVSWTKLGTSGALSMDAGGVVINHPQTITKWRSLGDAGSRKAFRQDEDLTISFSLADLTLEQYKHILNGNSITPTAQSTGVAGKKKIGLSRGLAIATYALLLRGASPYGDDMTMQWWIPLAMETGSANPTLNRANPALLQLQFDALVNTAASAADEYFGVIEVQTTVAGT